eukprot:scaffold14484_cov19-Tisochrysis_lutea.AAC.1
MRKGLMAHVIGVSWNGVYSSLQLHSKVQAPKDLGPLVELVIGHDECGGLKDAWHLEQVEILDPSGK